MGEGEQAGDGRERVNQIRCCLGGPVLLFQRCGNPDASAK